MIVVYFSLGAWCVSLLNKCYYSASELVLGKTDVCFEPGHYSRWLILIRQILIELVVVCASTLLRLLPICGLALILMSANLSMSVVWSFSFLKNLLQELGHLTPSPKCLSNWPDNLYTIETTYPEFQPKKPLGTICTLTAQAALPGNPGRATWALNVHIVRRGFFRWNSEYVVSML